MATITTDTFFDSSTRTAGETWTINNNAKLTVRTDTRWHANSPASMTGTIGTLSISTTEGGQYYVDATAVRWMPFDTGSGNVPAVGTTITQGAVSGYLLGVWASYTSAPTAVGAAMPASGYIKFREVTGGPFAIGALTDIGANATDVDRAGWIEVVHEAQLTMGQLGTFKTRGDWFYHETLTSGTAHQLIQFPTNNSGSNNYYYAVQIETGPGTGIFKWWHGLTTTTGQGDVLYSTTYVGTDARNRYFKSNGDGTIQLGGDGTNLIGYLPVAGCKIRIPNILFRSATSGARATNAFSLSAAYAAFTLTANVKTVDLQFANLHYGTNTFGGSNTVNIDNCAMYGSAAVFDNVRTSIHMSNSSCNRLTGNSEQYGVLSVNNSTVPAVFENLFLTDGRNISLGGTGSGIVDSVNVTFTNIENNMITAWPGEQPAMRFSRAKNVTINNLELTGNEATFTNCTNVTVNNTDFCVRVKGPLTATQSSKGSVYLLSNCGDFKIDGLTFGKNGVYANLQNYTDIFNIDGSVAPIYVRNIGTRATPLNVGSNATYHPNSLAVIGKSIDKLKIQRCYITNQRGSAIIVFNGTTSTTNSVFDSIFCSNFTKGIPISNKDCIFRGISGVADTAADGLFGVHYTDFFISDTTGALVWFGMQPSALSAGENFIYSPTETGQYLAPAAQVQLKTVGDYFYSEMTYFVKGHTSFRNVAPTITGTNTNLITFEYQLDSGSGWNGTWKTINAANLTAETISPTGFKVKIRGTQTSAGSALITSVQFPTNTSVQDQSDNLYTLDTANLSFTGLIPGSEVRVYSGTDPATSVEVGGTEATGGSTFTLSHSVAGNQGYIVILAMGYQPIYLPYTFLATDDSILIQPVVDRNYNNPV